MPDAPITRLPLPASGDDLLGLGALLADAIDSGAGVSFLSPFSAEAGADWWRASLAAAPPRTCVLVARDAEGIAASVRLEPAWAPNQPHRAEVTKLIVHRRARRRGLGRLLLHAVEDEARRAGFTLLTLDTVDGSAADALYRRSGWTHVGSIPACSFAPDGRTQNDVAIFFKVVAAGA